MNTTNLKRVLKNTAIVCFMFLFLMYGKSNAQQLIASFTADKIQGCSPLTVNFTNTSQNATAYYWQFGDFSTSYQQDPSHTYYSTGTFSVILEASKSGNKKYDTLIITVFQGSGPYFSVNASDACPGDTIIFNNYSTDKSNATWKFGDGDSSNEISPTHIYKYNGYYEVILTINSITCGPQTYNRYINIDSLKTPYAYFSASADSACPGDTITFNNSTSGLISSYLWRFGDGTTSTLKNPKHVYSGPGAFEVELLTMNLCGNTDSVSNTVVISNTLKPVAILSHNSTIGCPGDIFYFYDYSTGTITNRLWSFGDGLTSNLENPNHVYTDTGKFLITLKITNTCGNFHTDSSYIQIGGPTVKPSAYAYTSFTNVCPGDNVSFSDYSSGGVSNRVWKFGDGDSSTQTYPKHIFNNLGTYTVVLKVWNKCGNMDSDTLLVNVDSTLSPIANASGYPNKICPNESISFSDNTSGSVSSRYWYFGDGDSSTQAYATHVFTNIGKYYVVLKVKNNCGKTSVDTVIIDVVSDIIPNANPYTSTLNVCPGQNVYLNDNTGGAIASRLWNFGDGTTSTVKYATKVYNNLGTYTVKLTVTNNCNNSNTDSVIVNVLNNLSPIADIGLGVSQACPGDNIYFYDYTAGEVLSRIWNFGDGDTTSVKNPQHIYSDTGKYFVTLIVTNFCGKKDTVKESIYIKNTLFSTLNASAYPSQICPGETINYYVSITGSFFDIFWKFDDGSTATTTSPSHKYYTPGIHWAYVTVKNKCGNSTKDSVEIEVKNDIEPVVNFSIQPNPACPMDIVYFNDYTGGVSTWLWKFGDGASSILRNPKHQYDSSGTYTIELTVTNSCGKTKSDTKSMVINNSVIPNALFGVSPDSACPYQSFTFYYYGSGSLLSHKWEFGDGLTSFESSPTHYYLNPGVYTIIHTVTNYCGQSASAIDSVIIKNNMNPKAIIGMSRDTICPNESVTFSNNSTGIINRDWDFGDGGTSVFSYTSHVYTQPGIYTVRLIVTNYCGIKDTVTRKVWVISNFKHVTKFYVSAVKACPGDTIWFDDNTSNSINSWFWNFGDGTTSDRSSDKHVYSSKGKYNFYLVTTNYCGIPDTAFGSISITDSSYFTAGFYFTEKEYCPTDTISFYSSNSSSNFSWWWNFGDGTTSTLWNPSHAYTNSGVYTITYVATNLCGKRDTVFKKAYIINNAVMTSGYYTVKPKNACPGDTITFTAGGGKNYFWNFGDSNTSNLEGDKHVYSSAGVYDILLKITGNCGGVQQFRTQVNIDTNASVVSYFNSQRVICLNQELEISNLSSGASSYLWNFGDGNTSTSNQMTIRRFYSTPGTYNVSLTAYSSCKTVSNVYTILVTVLANPTAFFTANDTIFNFAPVSVNFTNGSTGASSYTWDFGDATALSNVTNPSHTYSTPGTFAVEMIAMNLIGCSDIFNRTILVKDTTTRMNNIPRNEISYTIYPNPNSGTSNLTFTIKHEANITISLYDVFGKEVSLITDSKLNAGRYLYYLDFRHNNLSDGIYFLSFEVDGSRYFGKLSIMK